MDANDYAIAYVQVLEVLKGLSRKEFKKIPIERIELYEKNKNKNYDFKINHMQNINEQITNTAQAILANLFVNYVATSEDKKNIYEREKQEYIKEEIQKRKNLQINPLFKNKQAENTSTKEKALVMVKEKSFFEKLVEKVKEFFKRKKK